MSPLLRKKSPHNLPALNITPENAGWTYVGYELIELDVQQTYIGSSGQREICLVLIGGIASITVGDTTFTDIGQRLSPFEQTPPFAVYMPPNTDFEVVASTRLELGLCSSRVKTSQYPVRLIKPEDIVVMNRGTGSNQRKIHNILMGENPAERLLVTEVLTPNGNWSSYPPHKHDSDRLPEESYLEETYYHRIHPEQGFVFQRVYTDDRSLDETMAVENGDCVLVPRGYHPVGVPHGYESYYLNTMAGPKREWKFYNDPDHEWILSQS